MMVKTTEINPTLSLQVAVVGHTNTGKTSLLRTLTRKRAFGQVQPGPGTTRHVEGVRIEVSAQGALSLFDTPGIEDSMALLDYIEGLVGANHRIDGPERIQRFLDSPEARARFEQEARVLRQLLRSEAGLYVIDVRDPVLAKYKDELRILSWCGKPLLPVLNFLQHQPTRIADWEAALADLGLHVQAHFDTVAPALDGEIQLYQKLSLLLNQRYRFLLEGLSTQLRQQRQQRLADAKLLLAECLVDVAAWQLSCSAEPAELQAQVQAMQQLVRDREQRCVQALLTRYQFSPEDVLPQDFDVDGYRWGTDLFHPEALKQLGVQIGKGLATGAVAGATFDLLTAGLSLGTGTLVGATVGGVWQGVNQWGQKIMQRWRGQADLAVSDEVLRALALRQLALIRALEQRGHAAQTPITLAVTPGQSGASGQHFDWRSDPLPPVLVQAQHHPQWSGLLYPDTDSERRQAAIRALAAQLDVSPEARD